MEIKYPPSSQQSTSGHHYSDLAHMIGSERKASKSAPNKYSKMLHIKFNKENSQTTPAFQKVTSPAQTLSRSPVVSHGSVNLREQTRANDALKFSPHKFCAVPFPAEVSPVTSPKNKYVKQLYAKLQKMPVSVPADAPQSSGNRYVEELSNKLKQKPKNRARHEKGHQKKREWFNSALKQVTDMNKTMCFILLDKNKF